MPPQLKAKKAMPLRPPSRTGQLRRIRGTVPGIPSISLQPVQDHVLLQRAMPEAPLEGGRAQEALRIIGGSELRKLKQPGRLAKGAKGRQAAAAEGGGGGGQCAICLGTRRSGVRPCADPRLHAPLPQGVEESQWGVQQACPMCRASAPDSARRCSTTHARYTFRSRGVWCRAMV